MLVIFSIQIVNHFCQLSNFFRHSFVNLSEFTLIDTANPTRGTLTRGNTAYTVSGNWRVTLWGWLWATSMISCMLGAVYWAWKAALALKAPRGGACVVTAWHVDSIFVLDRSRKWLFQVVSSFGPVERFRALNSVIAVSRMKERKLKNLWNNGMRSYKNRYEKWCKNDDKSVIKACCIMVSRVFLAGKTGRSYVSKSYVSKSAFML